MKSLASIWWWYYDINYLNLVISMLANEIIFTQIIWLLLWLCIGLLNHICDRLNDKIPPRPGSVNWLKLSARSDCYWSCYYTNCLEPIISHELGFWLILLFWYHALTSDFNVKNSSYIIMIKNSPRNLVVHTKIVSGLWYDIIMQKQYIAIFSSHIQSFA